MKKVTTSDRLKQIMKEKGLRQVDILERAKPFCKKYNTKLTKSDLSQYVSGQVAPGQEKLTILGLALDVNEAWLLGYDIPSERKQAHSEMSTDLLQFDNIFPIETKKFPLLGEIACGKPIFAEEDRESYVETGTDIKADFCLKCKGDSMINARIHDGDIVFIRKQSIVENGEIAAVIVDNEATLKRVYYYPEKSKLCLNAENPKYSPLVYVGDELNNIRILGKAIAFQSNVI